MKTVRIETAVEQSRQSPVKNLVHHLLVDVIPVLLLLAAMAYGMAFVAQKMVEPYSVELQAVSDKLS